MLKKDPKSLTENLGKTNRIVEGTIITGDIQSQADFRLDGEMKGDFSSQGKLVIGPSGKFTGTIQCKNLDIEGNFDGKLVVAELLNIKATAKINGEVITSKLAVEPGAIFTASCEMNKNVKNLTPESESKTQGKTA